LVDGVALADFVVYIGWQVDEYLIGFGRLRELEAQVGTADRAGELHFREVCKAFSEAHFASWRHSMLQAFSRLRFTAFARDGAAKLPLTPCRAADGPGVSARGKYCHGQFE
jgi:hypothetical protein